jgi:nucleoside-diphosphate-sugar epimerase
MACISLGRVVDSLLHAAQLPTQELGFQRTVLLTGISVSAQQMWDAAKPYAKAKVIFRPDAGLQALMDGAAKATDSERAKSLGFRPNASIAEIVNEYQQAALAHHG